MNNEVIKAMNKKETPKVSKVKSWWKKHGYKVARVVLFPVWLVLWASEKVEAYLNSRQKWSEERANEIFSYYIPRRCKWDDENKQFRFFDNGMGWNIGHSKRWLKLKDRRFWYNHCGFWGGDLRTYLIDTFELDGFTKEVGDTSEGWTEITFTLIEK